LIAARGGPVILVRPARDDVVPAVVLGVLVAVASAVYGSSPAGAVFGAGLCAPLAYRRGVTRLGSRG
jgi:hypothetical protein